MKTKKKGIKAMRGLGYKIWERNFFDAKRFFESKGNGKTRSRLKDKWFKDFKEDLEAIEQAHLDIINGKGKILNADELLEDLAKTIKN